MQKLDTIQTHEKLNEVYRVGDPGPGGAYHDYFVYRADRDPNTHPCILTCIEFQRGPRKATDARHGVCDQDLLEIVRDRFRAFCEGPMTNPETERALSHIEAALFHLNQRIEDRIARGVLGTMEK